jgi:VCBS repeat-containing protein
LEILTKKFQHISRIALVCHFEEQPYFLNNEMLFSDVNTQFMIDLIKQFNVVNMDYLACRTLQNQGWKDYFTELHNATGIPIGASDDNTGNLQYGGNWILESTQEDIQTIYFNDQIVNYPSLLTSVTINGLEDTSNIEITFVKLCLDASYTDIDASLNAFIVKSIANNGLLKIGTSLATANSWDVNTNNIIDASHSAYWTPAPNEYGLINAFKYNPRHNSIYTSNIIVDLFVDVIAVNDIPILASVLPSINFTQPVFEDASNIEISFVQLCLDASYSDIDGSVNAFIVTSVTNNGSLKIGSTTTPWVDGSNCTIDASHSAYWTPAPNINGLINAFKIAARDNSMGQSTAQFDINIYVTPVNEILIISGDNSGNVWEDVSLNVTGILTVVDADIADNLSWDISGNNSNAYGIFSIITSSGINNNNNTCTWRYDLSNNVPSVQALKQGQQIIDTFYIRVQDDKQASAFQAVTITINGTNDPPTISGDISGNVREDGSLNAIGILTAVDVDLSGNFTWDISGNSTSNYGRMSISSSATNNNTCAWSYDLSNNSSFVQALRQGQTVTDNFYVRVRDDVSANVVQLVTITINGKNDPIRLLNRIPNQAIDMSSNFRYVIPSTTFLDIDVSDNLTYSVVLSSNTPIPSWLHFEPSTRTFTSVSNRTTVGPLKIKVTATDGITSAASAYFIINVISQQAISGSVLDGYIKFGTITVRDLSNNIVGGPVLSDQSGKFSIPIATSIQPSTSYIVDCVGGTDIATSAPILYPLSAIYTSGDISYVMLNSSNVVINPLTTIVSDIVNSNIPLYRNNLSAVYTNVANAFGLQSADIGADYIYSQNIAAGIAAIKIATITKILSLSTGTDINTIKSRIATNISDQTVKLLFDASFIADTGFSGSSLILKSNLTGIVAAISSLMDAVLNFGSPVDINRITKQYKELYKLSKGALSISFLNINTIYNE